MNAHRHHTPGRAHRLIMARLQRDQGAENILIREVDNCAFCWFVIADKLADMITAEVHAQINEHPHMRLDGFLKWFAHNIAEALDHEDDDDDAA